jgi:hypothetical protein
MKRTTLRAVIPAIAMLFSLAAAVPAMAQAQPKPPAKHSTTIRPHDCVGNVYGLFRERWDQNTYQGNNPFGCSASDVLPYGDGTYQYFANGAMAWSPHQSGDQQRMVTSAYNSGGNITFQFGNSAGLNYDAWLLTIESWDGQNGHNIGADQECGSRVPGFQICGRNSGIAFWNNLPPGVYRISVEGCDITVWGAHNCSQGFTYPVYVTV